MKRGFQITRCAQKRKHIDIIPKAEDVVEGGWYKPHKDVLDKIGDGSTWFIGVDIETHDWKVSRGNKGNIGEFGFYNLCVPSDLEARIVQLGWSFGTPGKKATVKEIMICPDGYQISQKATNYHKISHEHATTNGKPLKNALIEFMDDLQYVVETKKGRIVCHHIEFDAGIIANEMLRCNMFNLLDRFKDVVRNGLCTMDHNIGKWLMQCHGEDTGSSTTMNVLSLKKIVDLVLPEERQLLEKHHSAGVDSLLVRRIAYALCGLSIAPCRMNRGSHETLLNTNGTYMLCNEIF